MLKTVSKYFLFIVCLGFAGCKTVRVDVEKEYSTLTEEDKNDLQNTDELSDNDFFVMEKERESDVAAAIVYLESPEIRYEEASESSKTLTGAEALKKNLSDKTILPEYSEGRLKGWKYKKGDIYQVHCQTYHSTLIQFEPGEKMLEVPYLSETEVWRISRGVGIVDGQETEMLIIKPDYPGLTSTLIVVTDRRIYQMELKSYKDHYMPFVQWVYPRTITDLNSWTNRATGQTKTHTTLEFTPADTDYMSFDYVIRYPWGKRPIWCPELAYDDGKFTYIVLDKTALHMEVPACFIGKREIMNKEYQKNVIVINQLIEKVTLRLGKDKVTVIKKIHRR